MSDLVGNPEDQFSHVAAHVFLISLYFIPAAPIKMKQKLPGSRQGLATIPHITNIDPFPNNAQVRHLSYMYFLKNEEQW